jgi:outer membrane lipoprotein SlyB
MDCGVIDAINVVEQKGEGGGLGAAGGAVVGGLIGSKIGSGRGSTAATVVGAVGGALAGNEIEKRVKTTKQYNVSVRMDNGDFKTFTFDSQPTFVVGEKVRVMDGRFLRS